MAPETKPSATASFSFGDDAVALASIGASYTPAQAVTLLALENSYLKREVAVLRGQLAEAGIPSAEPAAEPAAEDKDGNAAVSARRAETAALVDEYLAGQPSSGMRHLVVSHNYPRTGAEYGNGFVHRRIKHYQSAGIAVDVALAYPTLEPEIFEYDGVRVLAGHGGELRELMLRQDYRSVSVHFLTEGIWRWMEPAAERHRIHVFVHGYEAMHWIRNQHNFTNWRQMDREMRKTLERQVFWREVLEHQHAPDSYLFVSRWWRQATQDDMQVVFPASRSEVVHNVIDTDVFRYEPKDPAQRFRILWVRSAASPKFASDLAVECLKLLRGTPYWDRISATIIGDGAMFGEFEDGFGDNPNVRIERRFASQSEIAELHREHGIFLVPTRMDTQGVSRDEAMASGLVAVTNAVGAVPEFADNDCAVVVPADDAQALAEGIQRLLEDSEEFLRLSRNAAERAAAHCGPERTIGRELEVLGLVSGGAGEGST